MLGILFLIGAAIGAWRTWNAMRHPHSGRIGPLWLPALLTGELALHQIVWQAVASALFIWAGALDNWAGWAAVVITAGSWAGLVWLFIEGGRAEKVIGKALQSTLGEAPPPPRVGLTDLVVAKPRLPNGVVMEAGLAYGDHERHKLDIYRSADPNGRILLQIHGGSWMRGKRERHARPLMFKMAADGWLVASMSYRVSPEATFPDHLVDVKQAIAWLKANAARLGSTGDFFAVTGGSAGGHLAALAALTANIGGLQPGFADADTSVDACAPFYGIFDLTREGGTLPKWPWVAKYVMKSTPALDPLAWQLASPITLAHPGAPPFFVLHGGHDSAVSSRESRAFVDALEREDVTVAYAEIPGATHGFDYFMSRRSAASAAGVAHFLDHAYRQHRVSSGD